MIPTYPYLHVRASVQRLDWVEAEGQVTFSWQISTAKKGLGEQRGSERTPRGWHRVRAKIGKGAVINAVFRGRRPTGEVYDEGLERSRPNQDWILTRILWLGGLQPGVNRYGAVDSAWRFIYFHGSPDRGVDGQPRSHGCIRLKSIDMLELYDRVAVGMQVLISE